MNLVPPDLRSVYVGASRFRCPRWTSHFSRVAIIAINCNASSQISLSPTGSRGMIRFFVIWVLGYREMARELFYGKDSEFFSVWICMSEMARVLHAPTQAMTGFFMTRPVNFFSVWICIVLSFYSVSLQCADIIWTFWWLLTRPGFLFLVGLCFIVLRGPNVCSCNVSLLHLIAALSQILSWFSGWRFFISGHWIGLWAELSPSGRGIAFCFTLIFVLTFGHL
jgi:hypothetical protein